MGRNLMAVLGNSLLLVGLTLIGAGAEEDAPGKKIFIKQKCQQCHTITALNISKVEGGEEEEEAVEGEEKVDPPDLSAAGKEHTAEWIAKFMMKQEKNKKGRKHKKKFKGTDVDLKVVSEWLATLKYDMPKDSKAGASKDTKVQASKAKKDSIPTARKADTPKAKKDSVSVAKKDSVPTAKNVEASKSRKDSVPMVKWVDLTKSMKDSVTKAIRDSVTKAIRDSVTKAIRDSVIKATKDSVIKATKDSVIKAIKDSVAKERKAK